MLKISTLTSRARFIGAAVVLTGMTAISAISPMLVGAAQVTDRSLAISSSAPGTQNVGDPGSATNGAAATYTFRFQVQSTTAVQSWSAMFCTSAFGYLDDVTGVPLALTAPCTGPTGFTAAGASNVTVLKNGLATNAGTWTVTNGSAANVIRITSADGGVTGLSVNDYIDITIENITNPTTATYDDDDTNLNGVENTFFAHMDTYSDTAYSTGLDDGTVTSAVTESINITARVQETLKFSVGTNYTTPDTYCNALAGTSNLTLGDAVNGALATDETFEATSYFRLSTNSSFGADVRYAGQTLTSGTNTIDANATPTVSTHGTEQFGLALNSGDTNHSFTDLEAAAEYADGNGTITNAGSAMFTFDVNSDTDPVVIASSSPATPLPTGKVSCDTGSVRYIANSSNDTEAGIYRTSVNYIAVPRY